MASTDGKALLAGRFRIDGKSVTFPAVLSIMCVSSTQYVALYLLAEPISGVGFPYHVPWRVGVPFPSRSSPCCEDGSWAVRQDTNRSTVNGLIFIVYPTEHIWLQSPL